MKRDHYDLPFAAMWVSKAGSCKDALFVYGTRDDCVAAIWATKRASDAGKSIAALYGWHSGHTSLDAARRSARKLTAEYSRVHGEYPRPVLATDYTASLANAPTPTPSTPTAPGGE